MTAGSVSLETAVSAAGYGWFQVRLLLCVGMAFIADMAEIMSMSILLPTVGKDWKLSDTQKSSLAASVFAGTLFGALFWGKISDKFGRKRSYQMSTITLLAFGIGSAFSPNYLTLLFLRAMVGFGVAGAHVCFSLYCEFLPNKGRAMHMIGIQTFWTVGSCLEVFFGYITIEKYDLGWKYFLLLTSTPVFLMLLAFPIIPESPRWLMVKGRTTEAGDLIREVARVNGYASVASPSLILDAKAEGSFFDLFDSKMIWTTLSMWILWFTSCAVYYGMVLIAPKLVSKGEAKTGKINYMNLFITSVVELPGIFFAMMLFFYLSRRVSLTILLALSMISVALVGLQGHVTAGQMLAVVTFARLFSNTAFSVIWVYAQEAFPTTLRGQGVGSSSSFARLAGIVTPFVATNLYDHAHYLPVVIYTACCFVGCIVALFAKLESNSGLPDTIDEADRFHHENDYLALPEEQEYLFKEKSPY